MLDTGIEMRGGLMRQITKTKKGIIFFLGMLLGASLSCGSVLAGEAPTESQTAMIESKATHESTEYTNIPYNDFNSVKAVQQALNDLGFNCGSVDGVIGNNTENQIKAYQAAVGLEENGKITDALIDALGVWEEANFRFYIRFTTDDTGETEAVSFKKTDLMYQCVTYGDLSGLDDSFRWHYKDIGPDGFIYYADGDAVQTVDSEGNSMHTWYIYYNTPEQAYTGTLTLELIGLDDTVYGRTTVQIIN